MVSWIRTVITKLRGEGNGTPLQYSCLEINENPFWSEKRQEWIPIINTLQYFTCSLTRVTRKAKTNVPNASAGKESACSVGDMEDLGLIPGVGRFPGGEE